MVICARLWSATGCREDTILSSQRETARGFPALFNVPGTRVLALVLTTAVVAYLAWKIGQSPPQALQFAFNGIAVGAVYALLAMGFTLVYSTVWFFDLYYGAAAALGAYGVFYLRTATALGSRADVNNPILMRSNIGIALKRNRSNAVVVRCKPPST